MLRLTTKILKRTFLLPQGVLSLREHRPQRARELVADDVRAFRREQVRVDMLRLPGQEADVRRTDKTKMNAPRQTRLRAVALERAVLDGLWCSN